jgi:hypothetical protein
VEGGVRGGGWRAARSREYDEPSDSQADDGGDREDAGQPGGQRHCRERAGDQRQPGAKPDIDNAERHEDGQQTGEGQDRGRGGLQVVAAV